MSEHSPHDSRRNSNQSSPLIAGFLGLAFLLMLSGVGFGVWTVFVKREATKEAALRADYLAAEAAKRAQLVPYKIDLNSGGLKKVEEDPDLVPDDPETLPNVGEFELIERSGRKISSKDLLGEPWAVCFVFTKCYGPCLNIRGQMAKLQHELKGAPVRLVTITVDPTYDTPAVLKNYAEDVAADSDRWLFLTGEPGYVYQVLRENFRQFVREETGENRKRGYEVAHEASVLHIDAQGRIVGRYLGSDDGDMVRLRMALLAEANKLAENPPQTKIASQPAVAETPAAGRKGGR